MTVSGNQMRRMKSAARLYAVQALFQMESSGQTVEGVIREFVDHRFGATYEGVEMTEGDVDTFRALIDGAEIRQCGAGPHGTRGNAGGVLIASNVGAMRLTSIQRRYVTCDRR